MRLAPCAIVAAALAGCALDAGNFDDRSCVAQADCRPDQTCVDGLCAQNACAIAADCGDGYEFTCVDGGCVVGTCAVTEDCGGAGTCIGGVCGLACLGLDADQDGICDDVDNCLGLANRNQIDTDGDTAGDACDACPADENNDADADTICGDVDNCPNLANPLQLNTDADTQGDDCDPDDDNDGIVDAADPARLNPDVCGDADTDTCDDCTIGTDNFGPLSDSTPNTDGADLDGDLDCDAGDTDDDNDGKADAVDGCAQGEAGWTSTPTSDRDGDGCRDASEDTDDDADGVPDASDACPAGDLGWVSTPATDHDGDGCRDAGEDTDDDGDGVGDGLDPAPLDPFQCADVDTDSCDDCAVSGGPGAPSGDGLDTDADGACNAGDTDDDNDGRIDGLDPAPLDPSVCGRDVDTDTCDDCTGGGDGFGPLPNNDPASDGLDTDSDGDCNAGDADDDNDGAGDATDIAVLDPTVCGDTDADACDDCANGVDGYGPASDSDPANDGTDTDGDGACNTGDPDDDDDTVADGVDGNPLDPNHCRDLDSDTCDDCAVTGGPPSTTNDGTDTDGDVLCNAGDPDDDGDTVLDGADTAPLNRFVCRNLESDACDDCAVTGGPPSTTNDGPDTDADGQCNAGDACTDVDGDGLGNGNLGNTGCANPTVDSNDNNPNVCADTDADTCNDCVSGSYNPGADGLDTDVDGRCNASDADDDNDGRPDASDPFPFDPHKCGLDVDSDTCDDCAVGVDGFGPLADNTAAADGTDFDADGICAAGDCDDTLVHCTTNCTDVDGDQWCLPQDCNDCIPSCSSNCATNTDAEGAVDCVETYCGSNPLSATSVCRLATSQATLNTAITAANAAPGHDYILLDTSFSLTASPTHVTDNTGVDIRQCIGTTVTTQAASDITVFEVDGNNNVIEGVTLANGTNGNGYIMIQLDGNTNTVNECTLSGFEQAGVYITGDTNLIVDNRISGGGNAHVTGAAAVSLTNTASANQLVGNVLVQNTSDGVQIAGADDTFIDHNTISNNGDDGIDFATNSTTSGNCIRNNVISSNTEYAIQRVDAPLTWNTTASCTGPLTAGKYGNDAFGNGLAVCGVTGTPGCNSCSCLPTTQANFFELAVSPGFVTTVLTMPEAYCLSAAALINSMDSLGYDVNGDDPGLYTGAAPDGGGRESASGVCP